MSRIVFFCIPAWGHTNPTVEVVRQLTDMGHLHPSGKSWRPPARR